MDDFEVTDESGEECCPTCKKPVGKDGHMCTPLDKKDKKCTWCGALIVNERHICNEKLQEISYVCNTCGRVAVNAEHLCDPKKIE